MDVQNLEYDENMVLLFKQHIMQYFCRFNEECFDYFMMYFARKVQKPGSKNCVGMVLKSFKQGTGKGLVIDVLLGRNIIGNSSDVLVTNMDSLLEKFILF